MNTAAGAECTHLDMPHILEGHGSVVKLSVLGLHSGKAGRTRLRGLVEQWALMRQRPTAAAHGSC